MSAHSIHRTLAICGASLAAAACVMPLLIAGSAADPYQSAIVADPYDPFPEMQNPRHCRGGHCDDYHEDDYEGHRHAVILDCGGHRGGAAHTLREAVRRVPVNGEILIVAAPRGKTCIADGTEITKPLTIRPYDSIGDVFIQGTVPPPGAGQMVIDTTSSAWVSFTKAAEELKRDSLALVRHHGFSLGYWANDPVAPVPPAPPASPATGGEGDPGVAIPEEWYTDEEPDGQSAGQHWVACPLGSALVELGHRGAETAATALWRVKYKRDLERVQAQLDVVGDGIARIEPLLPPLHLPPVNSRKGGTVSPCDQLDQMSLQNAAVAVRRLKQSVMGLDGFAAQVASAGPSAETHLAASCLDVTLPLGDTLNIIGVNFIVRSGEYPCVSVQAGTVHVQHAKVDSRGTRWAFDVRESGRLVVEDSTIETDGGGIHARRAEVDLRHVAIQLERGRRGIGASLTGADGVVSDLSVAGGEVGLVISSGSRGIVVERPVISDSGIGIEVVGQSGQGMVSVRNANIQRAIVGGWVRNNAHAEFLGGEIRQSERVGVFINNSGALVRGLSHIEGATFGVAVSSTERAPVTSAPGPILSDICNADGGGSDGFGIGCDYLGNISKELKDLGTSGHEVQSTDASPLGPVDIDQNLIGPARDSVIRLSLHHTGQVVRLTNNVLDCPPGSHCISGEWGHARHVEKRGNRCTGSGIFSSCND